jgi:hypothetical protein
MRAIDRTFSRGAATLAALALATSAGAVPKHAHGPYTLDSHGKCRAAGGQEVVAQLCHVPPKDCRDPKTHRYVSCSTPGAVPAD